MSNQQNHDDEEGAERLLTQSTLRCDHHGLMCDSDVDVALQVRRSSSRLCLGVEHGDYNGCELFGVTSFLCHLVLIQRP